MPWTFKRAAGVIERPNGTVAGPAYAGHGAARNNPAMEGEHGAADASGKITAGGPTPKGNYRLAQWLPDGGKLGKNVIVLVPDGPTRTYILGLKRDWQSFRWHGTNPSDDASEGCIVSAFSMRDEAWKSNDHWIIVV